jgi:predicted 2-oxoglutarate/Fe(II)-dependent dioxygenase YbiX
MKPGLLVARAVWSNTFCNEIRRAMDLGDAEAAEIIDGDFTVDAGVRRAFDVTIAPEALDLVERALERLRPRVSDFFRLPLAGSVGVSCLRYGQGGHYLRHQDRDPQPGSGTEDRRVSVIVWLNSAGPENAGGEFEGGTLRLFEPGRRDAHALIPTAGTLVAFSSEWPHEVTPVKWGTRDVVVDWWLSHKL